jgi:sterol desaturase/sphingolipid hydroxylase (fatty acid hydroxylase superfamily)
MRESLWISAIGSLTRLVEGWASHVARMLLSPGSPYSLGAVAAVTAIAVAVTLSGRRNKRNIPLRALARALFPGRLFRSSSGKADLAFVCFNVLLAPTLLGWALFTSATIEGALRPVLLAGFGPREPTALPLPLCAGAMTVAGYLAYEFGYWLDHYLKHKIPFLWAFHKVHHSAESLSPLTNFRMHPVDSLIFFNITAVTLGTTQALVDYGLGYSIEPFNIWGRNILLLTGGILLTHLQHSHLWISFSGWLGRFILSPAHHQIHHSTNPDHFNRNFGSTLALWDRWFGTLHVPSQRREKLTFGVDGLGYNPHTVTGALLAPLADAWAEVRPASKPQEALMAARQE